MSSAKNEQIERGVVTEALAGTLFRVKMGQNNEEDKEILAYLSGKMRMHRIKVLVGDSVDIVIDPYGGKGRIVKRM